MGGVPSGLVRLAHCHQSHSFNAKYQVACNRIANGIKRVVVNSMPAGDARWKQSNRAIVELCVADMGEGDVEFLLTFLNHDYRSSEIIHWCMPGCCSSVAVFKIKSRQSVKIVCGSPPDVPLLYRWKHFEKANAFGARGINVHMIYPDYLPISPPFRLGLLDFCARPGSFLCVSTPNLHIYPPAQAPVSQ